MVHEKEATMKNLNDTQTLHVNFTPPFETIFPLTLSMERMVVSGKHILFPETFCETENAQLPHIPLNSLSRLPIGIQKNETQFLLIDGCKYAILLQQWNTDIPCLCILTPLTDFQEGLLRILLNNGKDRSIHEKIAYSSWIKKECPLEFVRPALALFNISLPMTKHFEHLSSLPQELCDLILSSTIDPRLLEYLFILSTDDQIHYLKTVHALQLSYQMHRDFLQWLSELSYAHKRTVTAVLKEKYIVDTLAESQSNTPQKTKKIHDFLYKKRYPHVSKTLDSWNKISKSYNPNPQNVHFEHAPSFESNRLTLTIELTNTEAAQKIFSYFNSLTAHDWQKLLYPPPSES